jgi:hypothetical protein
MSLSMKFTPGMLSKIDAVRHAILIAKQSFAPLHRSSFRQRPLDSARFGTIGNSEWRPCRPEFPAESVLAGKFSYSELNSKSARRSNSLGTSQCRGSPHRLFNCEHGLAGNRALGRCEIAPFREELSAKSL